MAILHTRLILVDFVDQLLQVFVGDFDADILEDAQYLPIGRCLRLAAML